MLRLLIIIFICSFCGEKANSAQYIVNSNSDANSGTIATKTGTLRWCIAQANLTVAKDTITFALTGGGPYTFTVASNYAPISNPLYINGFSQASSVQGQLGSSTRVMQIVLNGPGTNVVYGLQITSSNCVICGLVLQNFYKGIYINGGSSNWIWGCYIGTSNTGMAISAATTCFDDGIALNNNANNNIIGTNGDGTNDANEGNLIAGNGDSGAQYSGECIAVNEGGTLLTDCTGNWIAGNFLGTNETGMAALFVNVISGGQRGSGVQLNNCTANTIGTNADGTSDVLERNLISGNTDEGIVLVGSSNNKIKGNFIGVDKTGNAGLPNFIDGGTNLSTGQIVLRASSNNNFIGTDGDGVNDAVEGNVIGSAVISGVAASYSDGIDIVTTSTGNRVSGNKIGIGFNGTSAVSILTGITVVNDYAINVNSNNNIIGTNGDGVSDALEANYIGNSGSGVVLDGVSGCVVAGNFIGIGPVSYTTSTLGYAGIYVHDPTGANRIGSSAINSLETNYVCNGTKFGIWVDGAATSNNDLLNIRFNTIGIRPDGVGASNQQNGIYIYNLSNGDTIQYNTITKNGTGAVTGTYAAIQIGGINTNEQSSGNVIYNNTIYKNIGAAIGILNANSLTTKITQNSIYNNGNGSDATGKLKLGIDLNNDGVTANDNLDPDTGPNGLTNFPVINGVSTNTTCSASISGTYNGLATTNYFVEIYTSDVCNGDTSGVDYFSNATYNYGEGKTYLGTTGTFTTNSLGNGSWSFNTTVGTVLGKYITAVAIQANGAAINSTSEFSQCYSAFTDFGDAPDTYGTLLASCGAVHLGLGSTLRIGAIPTNKADGIPGSNADSDLSEDGLSYPLPNLNTKSTTYSLTAIPVTNSTGKTATLYAWIDFNGNGVFEATEFSSVSVPSSGTQTVTLTWNLASFTCAGTLVAGISYIRLRLTTDAMTDNVGTPAVDERSKGAATNGEVEDYRITILPVDFGDCPNTYPVATAAVQYDTTSGKVWAGVNKPAVKCIPNYSIDATGDGTQEDGLTTSTGALGGTYTWVIKLNSNLVGKRVYYGLWIDWDANQNFNSAMDAFYSGSVVTNGATTTNASVLMPIGSSSNAFIRLIASASPLTSTMFNATVTNGEVEDYSLFYILKNYPLVLQGNHYASANILSLNINNNDIGKYFLQRSMDATNWSALDSSGLHSISAEHLKFIDKNLSQQSFYYRIKWLSDLGNVSFSNTVYLDRVVQQTSFILYPNPATNVIHIEAAAGSLRLTISDLTGRVEKEMNLHFNKADIDISGLPEGTHVARVIGTDGKEQYQKFIKIK